MLDKPITFCIVVLSSAVLGFVMGFYVGWSQSPAVGAFLTGILGLIGGVFITIVSGGRDSKNHLPSLLNLLGFAVILLSLASLAGTYRGIEFRRSDWLSLTSVSSCSKKLDTVAIGKLVCLQRRMYATGIKTEDNNKIIKSLIDLYKEAEANSEVNSKVKLLLADFADMPDGPCTRAVACCHRCVSPEDSNIEKVDSAHGPVQPKP